MRPLRWLTALPLVLLAAPASSQPADPPAGAEPAPPSAGPAQCIGTDQAAAGGPKLKKGAPPPPDPNAQQLKALEMLQKEAAEYERGAKDYRSTLTMIVRHHYEEKRRRILGALEGDIAIEKRELEDARAEAIRRLEKFVALYSGDNAHPSATPDALFRLAALYEERDREKALFSDDPEAIADLSAATKLYQQIIREFPNYEEIAAVIYYLAHAYTDAGELEMGQQAFRTIVCHNKYEVKEDPANPANILVQPQPQDHDQKFWDEWINKHFEPLDLDPRYKGAKLLEAPPEEELFFRDPYPDECQPLPQNVEPGQDPKYVAEAWWKIGDYHFDQIDPNGGPYNLNRGLSAYEKSMEFKKPPLYGVAMYKRAWTYFKQQRYKTAVEWFVNLLHYADEQEAKTGDPGADFRAEAFTYIAGSLTYVDFEGPPEGHPYLPRNDVLDVESDPLVAEEKMRVAIERLQDPQLVPQDKKWTVEIYKSLAQEFIEVHQNRNAIDTMRLTLEKFPLDRDAPVIQNRVAQLYDELAREAPEGSAAKEEFAEKALAARSSLVNYVGTTKWTNANRDDPEALAQAEQLVKGGLRNAAADHTNRARQTVQRAEQVGEEEARELVQKAIAEYRLAESGWGAYYEQDPNAMDAYESKYWLADARYNIVVLQLVLGLEPKKSDIDCARDANIAVRDSNEDDKFLQPAAFNLVSMAERLLEFEFKKFEDSEGREGIEKKTEVTLEGEGQNVKVIKQDVPQPIVDAIIARDQYVSRIPPERDPVQNTLLYAYQAGDYYFVYGQFDEARKRLQPIYDEYCGKNEWGFRAWEKLVSMANFELNADASRKLVEGKDCSVDEDTRAKRDSIVLPATQELAYLDARKVFDEADALDKAGKTDEAAPKFRKAAAMYKAALDAAPGRKEAPEAAMNGAYAYKKVGEYDKAIEMYELFIKEYGSNEKLGELQKDDPKEYEQRTKFLKQAYDALANSYVLFFDYPKAAKTFDEISGNQHFSPEDKRNAAKQALFLYASLDDSAGMRNTRTRFANLGATPKELAEADFTIAHAEVKKWDEFSPDTGANAAARRNAEAAMSGYYTRNKNKDAAAQKVVEAAYLVAKMKRSSGARDQNKWWQNTIDAFNKYKRVAPSKDGKNTALGSREADMAAEGDYAMVSREIERKYDTPAKHKYKGRADKIVNTDYKRNVNDAKKWHDELQRIIDAYVSPKWSTVAVARQGSIYDKLRTGLFNTREPELVLFDPKQQRIIDRALNSDDPDLLDLADQVRTQVETAWRDRRDKELGAADEVMVARYATSVVLSRRYGISHPGVVQAIRRLALMTEQLGEAKMKQYTAGVKDLNYTDGMFQKIRPGQVKAPGADGMPSPLPVFVQ